MRARILALSLLFALALLVGTRAPFAVTEDAVGTHYGVVECAEVGNPVSDGTIAPDEYDESYFDKTTKILVYFTCENTTGRQLHVGIVAPGEGWVGLQIQARDSWDGTLNEVRLSRVPSSDSVQVADGLRNATLGTFESDASLGGSVDVLNATVGIAGAAVVYEFCVLLQSSDPNDSQLSSNGPFYFALADNPYDPDLNSEAMSESELQSLVLQTDLSVGEWTEVEISLAPSEPAADSKMLVALRDGFGYPLPGRGLDVFVQTTFGFLDLGPVTTNDQGVVEVGYAPRDQGTYIVGAAYAGGDGFLGSVAWRTLDISPGYGGEDLSLGPADPVFDLNARPIQAIIVVVVGGVWATYAYAIFVIRQTLRAKVPKVASPQPPGDSRR